MDCQDVKKIWERKKKAGWTSRLGRAGIAGVLFALLCLVVVPRGAAQTSNVTLVGTVTDSTGSAIPGADVEATNMATGNTVKAESDPVGRYTILNLSPGAYDVQASHAGFATSVRKNQVVYVGQTVTVNFSLQVATVAQTVEVQGESTAVVPTTESDVSRIIEPQELDNFPTITRSFSDLAALSPGVIVGTSATPSNDGGSIQIGGATNYETAYIVDGSSETDSNLNGPYINFAQDWIQEFSLISELPPAEYGQASGGVLNAITRSGTNQMHGRAYSFFQNSALNATPPFLPPSAPEKPPSNLERVGGMLGGPIMKNKLFYFFGYEYFHNLTSVPVNIPAAFVGPASTPGVYPTGTTTQILMPKIDWQANANNKFTFRFNYEHDNNFNTGVGASGSSVHTLGNSTSGTPYTYVYMGNWQRTISPTKLNNLQFDYNGLASVTRCLYALAVGNYPLYPSQPGSTISGDPQGYWAQITYSQAGVVTGCGGNVGPPTGSAKTKMDEDADLTDYFSFVHGAHTVKVGAGIDLYLVKDLQSRANYNGQFTVNGTIPFDQATPSTFPLSDFVLFAGGNGLTVTVKSPTYSFFAQDSVAARSDLTLNLGIRYDVNFGNSWTYNHVLKRQIGTNTVVPIQPLNNDYGDVAPRFGFAWTPFHNQGKTVLRGGLGVFYDQNHSSLDLDIISLGADDLDAFNLNATRPSLNPYCLGYVSCTSGAVPTTQQKWVEEILAYSLATYTLPNFSLGKYTFGGNTYTIPAPTLGPNGTGAPAPTSGGTYTVNPSMKVPGEMQVTGGIGQQFSSNFNAAADFVYVKGYNQIIQYNSNITLQNTLLNPAYGAISTFGNGGIFTNTSLRVKSSYRDHRGDSEQLAYSLGWASDNSYVGFNDASRVALATSPFNYNLDYGPSPVDIRHNLFLSGVFKAPLGIDLAPTFSFQSAPPYNATTTAAVVAGCLSYYSQCYPPGYTKNSLRGGDTMMLNARLAKNIKLGESRSLLLFVEGYNLPNRKNYGKNYQGNVASSSFKQPTAISTEMRELQFGARFDF